MPSHRKGIVSHDFYHCSEECSLRSLNATLHGPIRQCKVITKYKNIHVYEGTAFLFKKGLALCLGIGEGIGEWWYVC